MRATSDQIEKDLGPLVKYLGREVSSTALAAFGASFTGYDRDTFRDAVARWIEENSPQARFPSVVELRAVYVGLAQDRDRRLRRQLPQSLDQLAARAPTPYGQAAARGIIDATRAIAAGRLAEAARIYRDLADELTGLEGDGRGRPEAYRELAEQYELMHARRSWAPDPNAEDAA